MLMVIKYKNGITIFICTIAFFFFQELSSQSFNAYGYVINAENSLPISNVNILNNHGDILSKSNDTGHFNFAINNDKIEILIFHERYYNFNKKYSLMDTIIILLRPRNVEIDEISITDEKFYHHQTIRLKDLDGTSIYAGKKSEAILFNQFNVGLAVNNSRLIYNQISGLNIYDSDAAGIQLNIGGRGLDPNRTSNFNTRQNGYDISADVLGYPESYYTPPSESLSRIELIRGAASLQYGTQFGGLINFKIKEQRNLLNNIL